MRKNLSSLTDREIHDLIRALITAKISGSYSGPKIYGPSNNNSKDFNSSFNAVASFHGYPGLCPIEYTPANGIGNRDCCWHSDSRFLPWHRLIMMQFNYALQFNETGFTTRMEREGKTYKRCVRDTCVGPCSTQGHI